jgi:uncharacterized protein (DUF58 family)
MAARVHELRTATLVVAPVLAAISTLTPRNERILHAAAPALVILWMVMAAALIMRMDLEARRPVRPSDQPAIRGHSILSQVDVLTATGSALMWGSVAALVAAGFTGWASLSVLGVLGLATVYLAVTWTALVAGGGLPWQRAAITRAILPEVATEGDPLREEVRLTGVKIPPGMRLFATGRATRHGVVTRYAVGAEGSLSDVRLESELGAAARGEHHAPPLTLWLGDVLGLARTPVIERGEASFSVLPRPAEVRGARTLLGPGGDAEKSRPVPRQPTEGSFRIREYVPGDDPRRIHWVRTLQKDQLVVRLPDEVPPARPAVRLILDSDLWGTCTLSCRAPDELLDALVRVWLGAARALSELGTRVTLVAAAEHGGSVVAVERPMVVRAPREALRLGARVAWQTDLPLASMIARDGAMQVVVSSRPRRVKLPAEVSWIVVPEAAWTTPLVWTKPRRSRIALLPFPSGSADNRLGRRLRERRRTTAMADDRLLFGQVMSWANWATVRGDHVARPADGHVALVVLP